MNASDFNQLPYLLHLRQVVACGFSESTVRWLVESGQVGFVGNGRFRLYVRASVAPLLNLAMDWTELEQWPALLVRFHLLQCGLCDESIARLIARRALTPCAGHHPARYPKWQVKGLVGFPEMCPAK